MLALFIRPPGLRSAIIGDCVRPMNSQSPKNPEPPTILPLQRGAEGKHGLHAALTILTGYRVAKLDADWTHR
jgi:hypothetical protein